MSGVTVGETPAAVALAKDGILGHIVPGKGYIGMSTVDAETSSKINELLCLVAKSLLSAEDGQQVIVAAGEKALYEAALPAFDVLGKKSFFLGEVGNVAKMKLVVSMIMGSMMNAFSEGLVLADKSGLSNHTLLLCMKP